jgi:hypothetical protein
MHPFAVAGAARALVFGSSAARKRAVVAGSILALFGAAEAAHACDTCLRVGSNIHLPPTGSSGGGGGFQMIGDLTAPAYSSRPGAPATLHLDLDGIVYEGTWAGREPGTVPAYDIDGDPSTYSPAELENIRQIWIRVAEAFSPFEVNVTTVDPGDFTQVRQNARVIIGGSNSWYSSGAGGVAYVGGFTFGEGSYQWRTSWAFPANLGGGFPKYVSDATIHEAGHMFGLSHQAEFDEEGNYVQAYRRSQDGGLTAPNMGVAYQAIRGLWSDGPRAVGNPPQPQQQLDLDILSSTEDNQYGSYWNGFGYRPDDWADDFAGATELFVYEGVLTTFGVIEQTDDLDVFAFTATGGDVQIVVDGAEFGQMLDIVLNLYDELGELLFTDNPALSHDAPGYGLDASFSGALAAGEYFLEVASNGSYGDLGQYFVIAAGAVAIPEPAMGFLAVAGAGLLLRRRR